nr:hypothetical protein [uncultured Haemophilus sp.]
MKKLILTAIDDKDEFYFKQLVPFLLSLKKTNYEGDIGVIGYGLSEQKIKTLDENGIIVFELHLMKYKTLYIDRQWTAACIAEQYSYDMVALYDVDIWFPSKKLTIFNEVTNAENLYCAYDPAYGDFLEKCVMPDYQSAVKQKMSTFLSIHKKPWQVGVIVGYRNAWLNYRSYIEERLKESEIYTQKYGIDSLLICLYSLEYNKISELAMKYNCLPTCGRLLHSNLSQNGERNNKPVFTIDGEKVQGLHIAGPFRQYGQSFFDYISNHLFSYFTEGRKFMIDRHMYKEINIEELSFLPRYKEHQESFLKVEQVYLEHPINFRLENDTWLIEFQANAQISFTNKTDKPISFRYGIEQKFDSELPTGHFIVYNENPIIIFQAQKWYSATLYPNDTMVLVSRDLDSQTKMFWRLEGIGLTI